MSEVSRLAEYRVLGTGDVTVFMFHGAYGDGRYFDNTSQFLADAGYRVVAWNAPGYGKGDPEADFTIESLGDAARDLVVAEGTASNVLLGHSMGALVVPNALSKLGDRVDAVVLSGASQGFSARTAEEQERFVAERLAPIQEEGLTVAEYSPGLLTKMMAPGSGGPLVEHVRGVVSDMRTDTFVQAMYALTTYQDNPARVKEIQVPTLLLSGEYDTACPPSGMEVLHSWIPGSEYHEIKGAGHYAFAETPDKFHELLTQFLARVFPRVSE